MDPTYARRRDAISRVPIMRTMCDDRGQGLAEYGLILGLVAILAIVAVLFLKDSINGLLSNVGSSI